MSEAMLMIDLVSRRIKEAQNVIQEWEAQNNDLRAQVAELCSKLNVQLMNAAGLEAQRAHLMKLGSNSPSALALSGKFFKESGKPKTNLRLIYEAAFAAEGKELGIVNPAEWRLE